MMTPMRTTICVVLPYIYIGIYDPFCPTYIKTITTYFLHEIEAAAATHRSHWRIEFNDTCPPVGTQNELYTNLHALNNISIYNCVCVWGRWCCGCGRRRCCCCCCCTIKYYLVCILYARAKINEVRKSEHVHVCIWSYIFVCTYATVRLSIHMSIV